MNRYAESLRALGQDANHRGLCVTESITRQGAEEIDRLEQIVSSQAAEVERLRAAADKIRLFAQSALYWYASAGSQRVASTPRINHSGATWILRMIRDSEEKPPEGIDKTENR